MESLDSAESEGLREDGTQGAPHNRTDDRHPRVSPITMGLSRDREDRVEDARREITSGVDGESRGAAQSDADGPEQAGDAECEP